MKIRTLAIFVFLAMLMTACVTVEVPPEVAEVIRDVAEPAVDYGDFDSPNSCFHNTLNEATRMAGGEWEIEDTGNGYHGARQYDISTGTMFTLYAEEGPNTRVDTVVFLWDLTIDAEGKGGGLTYDFLEECGLNPMPLLEIMEDCDGTAAERSEDGCERRLEGFEVGTSIDEDGLFIVMVMDW